MAVRQVGEAGNTASIVVHWCVARKGETMISRVGYVDLQVNGYAGVDFNADVLPFETVSAACERMRADGVDGILATVVTDEIAVMCGRLANIHRACESNQSIREMIWGIHI